MGKRSGGSKFLMPVVGHPHKSLTNKKSARQAERRGLGVIQNGVLYWGYTREAWARRQELSDINRFEYGFGGRACDLEHEFYDKVDYVPYGPTMNTVQFTPNDPELNEAKAKGKAKKA